VFNVDAFFKELADLEAKNVPNVHKRIHVSSRCHLNLTLHAAVDGLSERALGKSQIGTTKRGIGPSYSTKASRDGLRVHDLYHEDFEIKLRILTEGYRARYGELLQYDVDEEIQKLLNIREKLQPYVVDAVEYMRAAQEGKRSILIEGSQALRMS
jgi:adenylosuccinate synthase